ncbi:LOW QUALITY PROTEIN: NF-X1-type zinc finger protein NFXL1-like [Dioscorea cayenensis subsp. rotundata]|uniref:LOW QUALITY PROTEIN: NF-X1-type zinc finger protein NFXL1-like n=1 Tax=Dioscorea cayennensis subsp. rotundata TaxID=55577 RepID=A0AB40BHI8_DIOCR|nr:LOW QUALITY PROTEIN: NF-X1-type zinc finger protein NFXL1-like [Dioscorea cayenensis subsp. rotundata]
MNRKPSRSRQAWVPRFSNPNPDSRHGHGSQSQSSSDPSSIPQLVQEIQDKLSRGAVECMICYDNVRRSAPIWSCSSCYSLFHLHCIRKWARSPTSGDHSSASGSASAAASWRCPGCQSIQAIKPEDLSYLCFCGSRRDPPNDLYLTAHSCGEPCRKPLDRGDPGENEYLDPCPHVCVLPCHPGPCPPCKAFAPRRPCPCGKKTVVRRCSDRTSPLTCGQVCGRLLSCGRHRCEKICHTGACSPCRVLITASCFCSKKSEVVLCGDMAMKGEVMDSDGFFSCDSMCGKMLACENHDCRESCHPGPCGDCELLPEKINTCHCGKTPLSKERESCLDPIPTCSQVCSKLLPCGVHRCGETCHAGDCPPCLAKVEQKCRCGSSTRTVECFRMLEETNKFVCEKPCGKKKGCGRHRCSEKCCPLSKPSGQLAAYDWDPHLCSISCGKRLQCGQHSCQLLCHSGHCPPCLETIFTDLTCACGKTSIPPPLPCGTPSPSCPHPCLVPQPCGHSAAHTCHFGDCPPCSVPVVKECIGGHLLLRNIPCGSKDIRCNQLCGKTRQCGLHACSRTCHPPPCDSSSGSVSGAKSSCGQVCGAPRRDCKHTCMAACHPSASCPDLRCEFPVTISCSCGRITASVPCGAGGSTSGYHMETVFESSVIQKLPVPLQPVEADGKKVPLGLRKLTCDEECAKMERKRVLADAFDITPNLEALHFGENASTSELLSDLLRREPKFAMAAEERFKFLVMGKPKGSTSSTLRVHIFCHMIKEKRDAIKALAERWKLAVLSAGWEPETFVVVHVTPKSKPPSRILGAKPGLPITAPPHPGFFDPLIDMDPRLVVSMLDLPRDADISSLVLRFGGECEMVWLNNKNALAVFNDPMRSATALRRLDHGSAYHGAVMVLPNGGASGQPVSNAWGLVQKEGTVPAKSSGNPWKQALATESESWGDATLPHWRPNEVPPIAASPNRWDVLDPNASANTVTTESVDGHNVTTMIDQTHGSVSSSSQGVSINSEAVVEETVDDWEEAYQ